MLEFSYNTVGKLKAVWLFLKLFTAYFLVVELIEGGVTSFELNYRKSYHVGRTKGKVHNSAYGSKAPPYLVAISSDLWLLGRLRSRASNLITTASMIAFAAPVTNFFPGGPRFYHLHLDSCQYSSQAHWSIVFLTIISVEQLLLYFGYCSIKVNWTTVCLQELGLRVYFIIVQDIGSDLIFTTARHESKVPAIINNALCITDL